MNTRFHMQVAMQKEYAASIDQQKHKHEILIVKQTS